VYGAHGQNFLKTILRLANERDALRIVADQIGAPTSTSLLADVTAEILRQYQINRETIPFGTYHVTAAGYTSWHGYAQYLLRLAHEHGLPLRVQADKVVPIATHDYPVAAPRPANSRLNTNKLCAAFGMTLPHWQIGVTDTLNELITS
jgi:dTDP-4-dehydrorhamnose reductase